MPNPCPRITPSRGVSMTFRSVSSAARSDMLPEIRAGNTYEYRVAGFCDAEVPTYNDCVGKINVPREDTARLRNCGIL